METSDKKYSLSDAEKAYQDQLVEFAYRKQIEDEIFNAEIYKLWAKAGFTPKRMEGRGITVFEHKGNEIKFCCFKSDGYWRIERFEVCKDCGNERYTFDTYISLENIGELLVSPTWKHHDCYERPQNEWLKILFNKLFKREG